jgi:hypothetical protein
MAKVLKATDFQKAALEGNYPNNTGLRFTKDANNNWIVGLNVIEAPEFAEIKTQLQALEQIDYNPIPAED